MSRVALSNVCDVPALTIWVISDGKPGHLNQSTGLAEALLRIHPGSIQVLPALPWWRASVTWLFKNAFNKNATRPDLIVGAGHATHLSLLAARRTHSGRVVVLMKPSLPRAWFDLCIVPEHDGLNANARTFITQGALNRVRESSIQNPNQGLILLGGPSSHFEWDSAAIELQIKSILARFPQIRWTLSDSRRTPQGFIEQLPDHVQLNVVSHTTTPSDWLPTQLARSNTVWITPDSVSMVYEALTAGATVGVFDLPVNPRSRVGRAIASLADTQRITRFVSWCANGKLHPNLQPLAEADRCAHWILAWLKQN